MSAETKPTIDWCDSCGKRNAEAQDFWQTVRVGEVEWSSLCVDCEGKLINLENAESDEETLAEERGVKPAVWRYCRGCGKHEIVSPKGEPVYRAVGGKYQIVSAWEPWPSKEFCGSCHHRRQTKCPVCGTTHTRTFLDDSMFCSGDCHRKKMADDAQNRVDAFLATVPSIFKRTELARLPDLVAAKQVLGWKPLTDDCEPSPAPLLHGPARCGKTRTAVKLLERLAREGWEVGYIGAGAFQDDVVDRTKPGGPDDWDERRAELQGFEVLLFDDLCKNKFTPRVLREFFNLLEHRTSHELYTIFTLNVSSTRIREKLSITGEIEMADAIMGRIVEFSHVVKFQPRRREEPAPHAATQAASKPSGPKAAPVTAQRPVSLPTTVPAPTAPHAATQAPSAKQSK